MLFLRMFFFPFIYLMLFVVGAHLAVVFWPITLIMLVIWIIRRLLR